MRRKDPNALEGIEHEKVRVTGDDVGRTATDREFQELVVLGITANCNLHIPIDPLSFARPSRQKDANVLSVDIRAELFSAQNFVEFGEYSKGKQDFSVSESCLGSAGIGVRSFLVKEYSALRAGIFKA